MSKYTTLLKGVQGAEMVREFYDADKEVENPDINYVPDWWIALAEKDESAPRWGAGGWEETS